MLRALTIIIFSLSLAEVKGFEDEKCDQELQALALAIDSKEFWALKLKHSWTKIQSSFGNQMSYESFNECLNFKEPMKGIGTVQSQYCVVTWKKRNNSSDEDESVRRNLSSAVCLPSACSSQKAVEFMNFYLRQEDVEAFDAKCQTNDPLPLDGVDIAAISVCALILILLLASTIYDVLSRNSNEREPHKLLIAFSLYTNGQRLFKVNRSEFDCLDGLKSIALIGIILSHHFELDLFTPSTNFLESLERFKHHWIFFFNWSYYCVDTFLVIGGFWCAITMLEEFKKEKFNAWQMIINRYMSYTPVFAATILIFTSVFRHIKSPFEDRESLEICYKYWWSALLHIQNYFNPHEICISHSWYLSVDFQLFLVSPLLIYPALMLGWKYLWNLPAMAILSSLSTMMTCLAHNIQANEVSMKVWSSIYVTTHSRVSPWLIGMVLGYVIFESRGREIKINKAVVWLLWILSFATLGFLVALLYPTVQQENDLLSVRESATLRGFNRLLWSLPIAWIIFACHKLKSGGIFRWLVSLPEWQPVARMSISIYLTSNFYQRWAGMIEKQSMTDELFPMLHRFFANFLVSLIIGALFCLAFEMPFKLIQEYFQDRSQEKSLKSPVISTKETFDDVAL